MVPDELFLKGAIEPFRMCVLLWRTHMGVESLQLERVTGVVKVLGKLASVVGLYRRWRIRQRLDTFREKVGGTL
mgnify:CR=1 FL=1